MVRYQNITFDSYPAVAFQNRIFPYINVIAYTDIARFSCRYYYARHNCNIVAYPDRPALIAGNPYAREYFTVFADGAAFKTQNQLPKKITQEKTGIYVQVRDNVQHYFSLLK